MRMRCINLSMLLVCAAASVIYAETKSSGADNRLDGVVYNAVRLGSDGKPVPLTKVEIQRDIAFIAKYARAVRTNNCMGPFREVPEACDLAGIDCYLAVPVGKCPWGEDYVKAASWDFQGGLADLVTLVKEGHRSIKGVTLGHVSPWGNGNKGNLNKFIRKIKEVKAKTKLPVYLMPDIREWEAHPELINEVDILMLNCWPHGDGFSVEDAAKEVAKNWNTLAAMAGSKKVIIGGTGWSSTGVAKGDAVMSPVNQAQFLKSLVAVSREQKFPFFWCEAFDSKSGHGSTFWESIGICTADGKVKPDMAKLLPEEARAGVKRNSVESPKAGSSDRQSSTPAASQPDKRR